MAFGELGDYITDPFTSDVRTSFTSEVFQYPFRSLFTKRSVDEREFSISDIPTDALVYDSTRSADLRAENVKPCGVNNSPLPPLSVRGGEGELAYLRFTSRAGRGCLSFALTNQASPDTGLPHTEGYLVTVESRHIAGRPLMLSVINQTAKHTELETYLPTQPQKVKPFRHDYFILPPLAADGLGYNVYLTASRPGLERENGRSS